MCSCVNTCCRRVEIYVSWKGYPNESDNTWEPLCHFPDQEDKDMIEAFKAEWVAKGKVWPSKGSKSS